jgi:hypothetical protein
MQGKGRLTSLAALVLIVSLCPVSRADTPVVTQAQIELHQDYQRSIIERLMERGRVVNMLDDFLAYWEVAKSLPLSRQRWLFRRTVQARYRDYFERAIYRGADARRRRSILNEFLIRVPERVEAIRAFNESINDPRESALVDALINFRTYFPEFRPNSDIYIGLSLFRFDGAIRPINNDEGIPDTLCLGAEVLAGYTQPELRVALVHELFHLYHFGFILQDPVVEEFQTGHIPLMVEGLAVAATELIYPNLFPETYLHFSEEQLTDQMQNLPTNSANFLELLLAGATPEYYEHWFSGNSQLAPTRGGYLLGQEVARRLLGTYTFQQLVRMTPAELREQSELGLAEIAGVRVLVLPSAE